VYHYFINSLFSLGAIWWVLCICSLLFIYLILFLFFFSESLKDQWSNEALRPKSKPYKKKFSRSKLEVEGPTKRKKEFQIKSKPKFETKPTKKEFQGWSWSRSSTKKKSNSKVKTKPVIGHDIRPKTTNWSVYLKCRSKYMYSLH